jgi:hypothetical protein
MRRYVFRLAILSLAVLGGTVMGNDQEIAQQIIEKLQAEKKAGTLKGFSIDLQVDEGTVWLSGRVANEQQQARALDLARRVKGVTQVVNDLSISSPPPKTTAASQPASRQTPAPVETTNPYAQAAEVEPQPATPNYATQSQRRPSNNSVLNGVSKALMSAVHGPSKAASPSSQDQEPVAVQPQPIPVEAVPIEATPERLPVRSASVSQQVAAATGTGAVGSGVSANAQRSVVQAAQPVANVPQQLATAESLQPLAGQAQQVAMMPMQMPYVVPVYAGSTMQVPLAMGAARPVAYMNGQMADPNLGAVGAPVPMYMPGSGVGIAPARYDHPSMPGYAWPSYAAYPNYAAVTYPKQYSPTAWPYIGPFYPYPQVPLGWRKVTLEWDDGWWMLDFKDRRTMYNH